MDNKESKLLSEDSINEKNDSSLDKLLDDALEDFNKPVLMKKNVTSNTCNITETLEEPSTDSTVAWTDEFIKQATQNFESTMKCVLDQQKEETPESGDNEASENVQLDYGEISAEFTKFAEAAAKAATEAKSDDDFTQCLAQTMQQMTKNKEDAQEVPSAEDLGKMFEQFGLGQAEGETGEMGSLFPLMQNMLENILSKDVLYHPIKEIVTKYPDWLADNRSKLPEDEFNRFNKQYSIMKQVIEKFESEQETDSEETKSKNFESILQLMQKVQEFGHPPADLVGEEGNPLVTFDESGNPKLPDLSSLLGATGFPSFGSTESDMSLNQGNGLSGEQCTLM